jgi:transcriptional regulator with XRE-family HTH domain
MTLHDLSAELRVTQQQLQKYERGINRMSASRLIQIADALQVDPAHMIAEARAHQGKNTQTRNRPLLALARAATDLPAPLVRRLTALAHDMRAALGSGGAS